VELLGQAHVWAHPFIIGELACGNLSNRESLLHSLGSLPQVPLATHEEVLRLVDARRLMGRGLGWIDMHLLASATLAKLPLWTMDRRLSAAAFEIGVGARR
jgi:predicted nucleic acid-binding protein